MVQTFGVVVAAAVIDTWWAWLVAFVLMGRGHGLLNILAHEAAHRLLFPNRFANDLVGRWLLGYPTFQPFYAYRRAHFAHHRDELGPDEPDTRPVPRLPDRQATRGTASCAATLTGESAYKNFKAARARGPQAARRRACRSSACRSCCSASSIAVQRPLAYVVWIGSWCTLWKFSNRLRAIAEHGGMERSADRRRTTHVIRQTWLARSAWCPYNTGWHLAHHVDMGVPWRNLPRFHAELVAAGWVTARRRVPVVPGVLAGLLGGLTPTGGVRSLVGPDARLTATRADAAVADTGARRSTSSTARLYTSAPDDFVKVRGEGARAAQGGRADTRRPPSSPSWPSRRSRRGPSTCWRRAPRRDRRGRRPRRRAARRTHRRFRRQARSAPPIRPARRRSAAATEPPPS